MAQHQLMSQASVPVAPAPLPARPVRPDVQPASSPPQMTQAPEPLATPTPPAPPPAQAPAAQPPTQLAPAETVEDQEAALIADLVLYLETCCLVAPLKPSC